MRRYILAGVGAAACILAAVVFMAFEDAGFSHGADVTIAFPTPGGPYSIGRKLFDWTDLERAEPFHPSRRRELMAWIWYPAARGPGASIKAEYVPGQWGRTAARWEALDMRLRSGPLWSALFVSPISAKSVDSIHVHSIDNAPIADTPPDRPEGFPVLLFSPGLGKMPTDYTAVVEDIVSYGYVVVGVNPTYFVSITAFENGRSVGAMPPWERLGDKLKEQFPIWVQDLQFAAGRVTALAADGRGDFARKLDVSRYGAFGHSYGGAAALAAAGLDSRVAAAMDWDGTPRGFESTWASKPAMLLQSDHGAVDMDRSSLRYYDSVQTGYRMTIQGAFHRGFSDEVAFPLPPKMRKQVVGTVESTRMIRIVSAYTRAFFDTYLRNRPVPLLCGPNPEFPEVTARRRGTEAFCESAGSSIPTGLR